MIMFLIPLQSGVTISKLTEERMLSNQETKILQEKLVSLGITVTSNFFVAIIHWFLS